MLRKIVKHSKERVKDSDTLGTMRQLGISLRTEIVRDNDEKEAEAPRSLAQGCCDLERYADIEKDL